MEEGYLALSTDEKDETAAFDLKKFLNDLKLAGLLSMDFVLEFYPEPFDEDKQYAIWQLIQNLEEETITLSMIERINEGMGWDTAQSLEIVFNLNGENRDVYDFMLFVRMRTPVMNSHSSCHKNLWARLH